jgi:hypothetical protein
MLALCSALTWDLSEGDEMSDAKPKRTAREPGRGEVSTAESVSAKNASTVPGATVEEAVAPRTLDAAEAVSAGPEAVAEFALPTVSATRDPSTDSADVPADAPADDPWAIVAEAQATLARGFAAVAVELTGMTGSGIVAAGDAAIAMVEARTFTEAVEIGAGLTRRGIDAMIEGSAKLSAIGVTVVSEASRSILSQQPMRSHIGAT